MKIFKWFKKKVIVEDVVPVSIKEYINVPLSELNPKLICRISMLVKSSGEYNLLSNYLINQNHNDVPLVNLLASLRMTSAFNRLIPCWSELYIITRIIIVQQGRNPDELLNGL